MNNNRIIGLDLAKGIAIFLVVWMHCIQYIFNESFQNSVYAFVYSFHMPLFIIISGYLYSSRIGNDIKKNVVSRAKRLLTPNLLWGGILCVILGSFSISTALTSFWFLYTLFVVILLYEILALISKNTIVSMIVLSIGVLLIPGMEFIKFTTPFFGIGLILGQKSIFSHRYKLVVVLSCLSIGIASYSFLWSGKEYIYITSSPSFWNINLFSITAYCLRIFTGTALSIGIVLSLSYITSFLNINWICRCSKSSLGIYILHLFCLIVISQKTDVFQYISSRVQDIPYELTTFLFALFLTVSINRAVEGLYKHYYVKAYNLI